MKWNRIAASLLAAMLLVGLLTACTVQDPKGTSLTPSLPVIDAPTGGSGEAGTAGQTPTMPTVTLPSGSSGTEPVESKETDAKDSETQTPTSAPETQPQLQPTQGSSTPAPSTTEPAETQKPVVASNDTNEDLKEKNEDSEEDLP